MRAQKRAPGSVTARVAPAIVRHIYNHRFEPGAPFLAFRVRWARIIGVLDSLPVTVSSERRQVASSAIMRRRITRRRTIKGPPSKLCGSIKRQVGHQRSLALRRMFCTAGRTRRSVRDANSTDGDVGRRRRSGWRAVRTNQAGVDHGAAVPSRIAHLLNILADELVGGFRMPGIDLAHIGHKHLRINPG